MVLMYIKENLIGEKGRYDKGSLYFTSEQGMVSIQQAMSEKRMKDSVGFFDITNLWEPFNDGDPSELIIIRTGGVGDLLALSCVAEYCSMNTIKFVTAKYLFPVFKWYSNDNVFLKSVEEPVYRHFHPSKASFVREHTKRLYAEGLVEAGGSQNWYEVFFGAMGVKKIDADLMRPQLIQRRLEGEHIVDPHHRSILITNRASAQMRSMEFSMLYECVKVLIEDMDDVLIYVHIENLTDADKAYIKTLRDPNLRVIRLVDVGQYLLDCYDVTLSVSVDTAAVHFREGVNKPAIGIYSAFTADSRTKYYTVTHSFNLKSECDLQPCFIHQLLYEHVCPKAEAGDKVAPCMGVKLNSNIRLQLIEGMRDYLNKHLRTAKTLNASI